MNESALIFGRRIRGSLTTALLLVVACTLAACAHTPDAYRAQAGRVATMSANIELTDTGRDLRLPVRILWPVSGGPYPVVLFSHGGGSSGDRYELLATHWATAGYVVILPTHRDSRARGFTIAGAAPSLMLDVLESRRQDLVFIADQLSALPATLPALAGRIDAERIAVAGHSMGGATALTVSGLVIQDIKTGERLGFREPRFDALFLLTEPGNSPMMPVSPWQAVPVPVFVATGSRDYSGQWNGPPKTRLYDFAPDVVTPAAAPHHYLFIDGMDHYLGGLVCREDVPGPPDAIAVAVIQNTSTAFLDAYLKDERAGASFLKTRELEPQPGRRATLSLR